MGETSLTIITGLILCGALGALSKDIFDDNCLQLPKIFKGKLFLGFIGSMVLGGAVGYFVDHSPITAFFAGYTGMSTLTALVKRTAQTIKIE